MSTSLFENRRLLIATKHQKETVIAPLLEKHLGVSCFINEQFDTDQLGTFSGEVERKLDPVSTARQKCLLAMEASNCDLAVASEGSFGAHPSLIFAKADDEFLIFIDKKHQIEIIARELSTETNFDGKVIKSENELMEFAKSVQFPSHALILRKSESDTSDLIKGITDQEQLMNAFNTLLEKSTSIYAETDMRAMHNPSRMLVIEKAAKKLVEKINSCCPECTHPGFDVSEVRKGLRCGLCGSPTQSTLSFIYSCQKCNASKEELHPHGKTNEDPTYCDFCNP